MKYNKTKRILFAFLLILALTSCSVKNRYEFDFNTYSEKARAVTTILDTKKGNVVNLQGYIVIDVNTDKKTAAKVKKVTVKDFERIKEGIITPLFYNYEGPFNQEEIKALYNAAIDGNYFKTIEYESDDLNNYGFEQTGKNKYTTKVQYLIFDANSIQSREVLKKELRFTIVYEFDDGQTLEKQIRAEITE